MQSRTECRWRSGPKRPHGSRVRTVTMVKTRPREPRRARQPERNWPGHQGRPACPGRRERPDQLQQTRRRSTRRRSKHQSPRHQSRSRQGWTRQRRSRQGWTRQGQSRRGSVRQKWREHRRWRRGRGVRCWSPTRVLIRRGGGSPGRADPPASGQEAGPWAGWNGRWGPDRSLSLSRWRAPQWGQGMLRCSRSALTRRLRRSTRSPRLRVPARMGVRWDGPRYRLLLVPNHQQPNHRRQLTHHQPAQHQHPTHHRPPHRQPVHHRHPTQHQPTQPCHWAWKSHQTQCRSWTVASNGR